MTKRILSFAFALLMLAACRKETATLPVSPVSDYFPLEIGKYITYNLDSTVFTNFNQTLTVRHYQAQYRVEDSTTDNTGNPGFVINRYLRSDSTRPWEIDNVFTAFPASKSIEYVQDNLRFIKLMGPVTNGFSWKGNSYLAYDPYRDYVFANPAFMEDWNYTYENVNQPMTINSNEFENTITVFEVADSTGNPEVAGTKYAEKTSSVEMYAKGVGLIYKDFIHWEFQGTDNTFKGFGERLSIVDHN